jgi:hypothetical protein
MRKILFSFLSMYPLLHLAVSRLATGDLTALDLLGERLPPASAPLISANRVCNGAKIMAFK